LAIIGVSTIIALLPVGGIVVGFYLISEGEVGAGIVVLIVSWLIYRAMKKSVHR